MNRLCRYALSAAILTASLGLGCEAKVETDGQKGGNDGHGGGGGSSGDGGNGGHASSSSSGNADECTDGSVRACPGSNLTCAATTSVGSGGTGFEPAQKCEYINDHWAWGMCECPYTPLVLSFDGAPVELTTGAASYAFDLSGIGASPTTDWPTARTPWLAIDRDGDGRIGGGELFGSATRLAGGDLAENGFIALGALDSNHDGQITAEDEAWPRISLWSDRDGDRVSEAGELAPVASRRIVSIDLAYTSEKRCDGRGNCEIERARFRYLDEAGAERTGEIIDIYLSAR